MPLVHYNISTTKVTCEEMRCRPIQRESSPVSYVRARNGLLSLSPSLLLVCSLRSRLTSSLITCCTRPRRVSTATLRSHSPALTLLIEPPASTRDEATQAAPSAHRIRRTKLRQRVVVST